MDLLPPDHAQKGPDHGQKSLDAAGIDAAELLRVARDRAGLSQRDLARRADTSQSVVARIELGETSPTVSTLNRLIEAAGFRPVVHLAGKKASSQEIVRRLRDLFREVAPPGVASVYLFGSAASGGHHRESDVDVAVLLDPSVCPSRTDRTDLRVRLSSRLVDGLVWNDVDLVVLNDLPPLFARSIVLDGRRLFTPMPDLDRAFVRDIQLRAADLEPFLRRSTEIKRQTLER